jgi:hypothetical protein
MNYIDIIKADILKRVLIAKTNAKIKDNKLISLLEERGPTLHRNLVNDWRNSKSSSFMDYLDDIAEFTGTSVDYLIGRNFSDFPLDNQAPQAYNEYDVKLLNLFRELNEEGKEMLIEYADTLTRSGKYKKDNSRGVVQENA